MFGRTPQWSHQVLGCNAFEYWLSIFTKVRFFALVSSQRMSSWPAHMFPPPDMLQKCVLSLWLSFHLPTPWRIHVTGSYICLPKGLPKFKVSNSDLYEIGNEKETARSYFFLLNCSKEKILHGICPEIVEDLWSCLWIPLWGSLWKSGQCSSLAPSFSSNSLTLLPFFFILTVHDFTSRIKLLPVFLVSISREPGT